MNTKQQPHIKRPPCPKCKSTNVRVTGRPPSGTYYLCKDCQASFRQFLSGSIRLVGDKARGRRLKPEPNTRRKGVMRKPPTFRVSQDDILRNYADAYTKFRDDHGKDAADNYLAVLAGYSSARAAVRYGGWTFDFELDEALTS